MTLRCQGLGERFDQKGHGTFARHDTVGVLAERFHPRAGGKKAVNCEKPRNSAGGSTVLRAMTIALSAWPLLTSAWAISRA
nr:hypothetical protein GCM10020185_82770 [Pseudomonas brassicacearum subsp. brassicacearum]